ncbi:site-specific DNA-methyltransferase [Candidatus Lokiarchaeum ossiferum]|uniref:site-specific DNA-methyltransferase n=1 Tax=Candidatus Lokiarchaeum ossiferum TaxID=2951803 RepID=UPI00352EC7C0
MNTKHRILFKTAQNMNEIAPESVDLVVTSPPYPMIEMWDEIFANQNPKIREALEKKDGNLAFSLMHLELDKIWMEISRILTPGGIVCINIGDTTRTIAKRFQLYPSHSKIIECFMNLGFQSLPEILWRKQTNAPNKFMGSGMLPPGAYVTLEHEYILIFRKGNKKEFKSDSEKQNRRESAYFWEERNVWFSDIWDFKGISQGINNSKTRERSAAYPFELAYRLINMFSVKGDIILDPFLGTGTTMLAAIASERNSIGFEIDEKFREIIQDTINSSASHINEYIENRIEKHRSFIADRVEKKGPTKYMNDYYNFPVITRQEIMLIIRKIQNINVFQPAEFEIEYL